MTLSELAPWLILAALGLYHGVNPAMGWLFAVALGLQEQRREAVLTAFAPIAIGHASAVVVVIAVFLLGRSVVSIDVLRIVGAVALVGFGIYKLVRQAHPRWVGMRVGFRDLVAWSFLMASAHGAGLMLVPVLLNVPGFGGDGGPVDLRQIEHVEYMFLGAVPSGSVLVSQIVAVSIHAAAMFGAMAIIAIVVYERVGVSILRRAWLNVDRIWAVALIVSGLLTLVI